MGGSGGSKIADISSEIDWLIRNFKFNTICQPSVQREDSITSLEVCYLLQWKQLACISLNCLPFGLQSCFQGIWSFPLYKISLHFLILSIVMSSMCHLDGHQSEKSIYILLNVYSKTDLPRPVHHIIPWYKIYVTCQPGPTQQKRRNIWSWHKIMGSVNAIKINKNWKQSAIILYLKDLNTGLVWYSGHRFMYVTDFLTTWLTYFLSRFRIMLWPSD